MLFCIIVFVIVFVNSWILRVKLIFHGLTWFHFLSSCMKTFSHDFIKEQNKQWILWCNQLLLGIYPASSFHSRKKIGIWAIMSNFEARNKRCHFLSLWINEQGESFFFLRQFMHNRSQNIITVDTFKIRKMFI